MVFSDYLKKTAPQIEKEMSNFFNTWEKDADKINKRLTPLTKIANNASNGGKRLRGVLVKLGYEMFGGNNLTEIQKPAAAFEIFQTAILAHDDIIDNSPLRRGKPTIFKALGGDHYALSQTICLGDIGFFQALEIVAKSNFSNQPKNQALQSFTKTMVDTALGEVLDVEIPYRGTAYTEEDVLTVIKLKTARYSITGPLELGAILAGADTDTLNQIGLFGESLGIAYQIQDDILGVFGDEKQLGKSVTSDIEEGKNTLLIIYALAHATPDQKKFLDKYYGKGKVGETELKKIRQLFTDTGSLEYSRQVALKYVRSAKQVIPKITKDQKYQNLLQELADFLINRDK